MSTIQASLFESIARPMPTQLGRTMVRSVDVGSILTACKGKLSHFDYSLNPYRGCGFGCSYCYAAFFVPDDVKRDAWGDWVEVKSNAVAMLARQRNLGGAKIIMSSATDPYQPIEAVASLSRSILEHFAERREQPSILIQTRGPLVTRDIDVLRRLRDVRVNVSVTTDCDEARKRFEPACASIERRLDALRELKAAGVRTGVSISPMLPIKDPIAFARTLRDLKADRYYTSYFHYSDKLFASSTGQKAIGIGKELGWSRKRYERTKEVLTSLVPGFGSYE